MTYFEFIARTSRRWLLLIALVINFLLLPVLLAGVHLAFDVARCYVHEHFSGQPEQQHLPQPHDAQTACRELLMVGEQMYRQFSKSRMRT